MKCFFRTKKKVATLRVTIFARVPEFGMCEFQYINITSDGHTYQNNITSRWWQLSSQH